jgi:glycosyltransferase involved in cell wall biosynthesis
MISSPQSNQYCSEEIAIIIPTKDRPDKIKNVLNSLVQQTAKCGRIIIVASGQNIETTVLSFNDRLPVEYYHSEIPGQIRQRNIGIQLLDERTKLVGTLDDDIIVERDALEKMIGFWNTMESETAGVGFNVAAEQGFVYSRFKHIFGLDGAKPGLVLKSGFGTKIMNVSNSIRSYWLNGGATVWKQDILKTYPHKEINARWAICEDIMYSYPIGKIHPFFICAEAKVIHDHESVPIDDMNINRYIGRTKSLWHFHFAHSNADLSVPAYVRVALITSLGAIVKALLFSRNRTVIEQNIGVLEGIFLGFKTLKKYGDLYTVLEDQQTPL